VTLRLRRSALVAATVLAAALVAGCTVVGPADDDSGDSQRPGGSFPVQPVRWGQCGEDAEAPPNVSLSCGTVTVPADWAKPQGPTLKLAVIRARGKEQHDRIGSLLMNPGGPGVAGLEIAATIAGVMPEEVLARFDLVGFDPRGVAESSPVTCVADKVKDSYAAEAPDETVPADGTTAPGDIEADIAGACKQRYGDRLRTFNTEQTARDLDALRQAVGDRKLSYVGYSYGTLLGAVYAHLFPKNVRALVLDGPVDPRADDAIVVQRQAAGFESAFKAFAADCVARACPLAPDPRARVVALLGQLRQRPLTENGRQITEGYAFIAVVAALYSQQRWGEMAAAIDDASKGRPRGVVELADSYNERDPDGHYSNLLEANAAIGCADQRRRPDFPEIATLQREMRARYPLFGGPVTATLETCARWPVKPAPPAIGKATGSPPILVVATTNDPATPYQNAKPLADLLGAGQVFTVKGEGHTAFPLPGCVDDTVSAYLVDLKVPDPDATCETPQQD
jgi:pimeloyl-ACP methyl ester carboxylesterase